MSYRLTINDVQIFGNNEAAPELIDFLKSNGVAINEDLCFDHTFEPGQLDFMALINCIEAYYTRIRTEEIERATQLYTKPKSMFCFDGYEMLMDCDGDLKEPLTDIVMRMVSWEPLFGVARCIVPLLYANVIEQTEPYADKKHLHCYKQRGAIHIRGC
jgi:hypothetical protein